MAQKPLPIGPVHSADWDLYTQTLPLIHPVCSAWTNSMACWYAPKDPLGRLLRYFPLPARPNAEESDGHLLSD